MTRLILTLITVITADNYFTLTPVHKLSNKYMHVTK